MIQFIFTIIVLYFIIAYVIPAVLVAVAWLMTPFLTVYWNRKERKSIENKSH